MTTHRILIVDDDAMLLRVLADILRYRMPSWVADTCGSAAEAEEKIREGEYDVILTDVQMPGMTGLELLRRLRRLCPRTPTLLMTGLGGHEVAVRAVRAGAFDYLEKPIDHDYLVASLARACRLRDIDRQLQKRKWALERRAADLARVVEEQTRELREANRIKDEFLATLSHELRTPLTAILGWARLMVRGSLDAATQEQAIAAIERNASLQAHLIEDLLDVSRIMTGKLRLVVRKVQLAAVLAAAVDAVAAPAAAKGIVLERVVDPGEGEVSGDADRLQQVFVNLLSNAIKFTPEGGRVEIALTRRDARWIVTVSDSGVGIHPDFLPHIFERFRQADSSYVRLHGGLGLGLAIVRQLVELHGGTVRASSSGPSQGSTFEVALPLLAGASTQERAPSSANGHGERTVDLSGMHVLVVEDERDTRDIIQATLEGCGATVHAVDSGAGAIAEIDRSPPNVILCDIGMPHEDGYALIRRIRDRPPERGGLVPAAAVTAYARSEDIRHALAVGFDAHIAKPFEPVELIAAVFRLTETSAHARLV